LGRYIYPYAFSIIVFVYDLVLPSPFLGTPSLKRLTKSFWVCHLVLNFVLCELILVTMAKME